MWWTEQRMKEGCLAILQPMVCQPAPPKTHRLEIVLDGYSSHLWNEMMLPQSTNSLNRMPLRMHRHCEPWCRQLGEGGRLTSEEDPAKEAVVSVQGIAVPAVLAELVLALRCPLSHTQANSAHHVWVSVAQLTLAAHQAWHIVTHHPRGATWSSHVPVRNQRKDKSVVNGAWCSQEVSIQSTVWVRITFLLLKLEGKGYLISLQCRSRQGKNDQWPDQSYFQRECRLSPRFGATKWCFGKGGGGSSIVKIRAWRGGAVCLGEHRKNFKELSALRGCHMSAFGFGGSWPLEVPHSHLFDLNVFKTANIDPISTCWDPRLRSSYKHGILPTLKGL